MNLAETRFQLKNMPIYDAAILTFQGVDGYDVYNCSVPFTHAGKRYLFGRVERRSEYTRSWVRIFTETAPDVWTLVPDSMIYTLEDPYFSWIHNQMVLGGVHVRFSRGEMDTYYSYFYRGTDPSDLYFFTSGPAGMKDVRLVELADGRIGVFSRPRNGAVMAERGSESMIGFAVIDSLDELDADVIENAPYIEGLFCDRQWGGCNQVYLLDSGKLGVIGHFGYYPEGQEYFTYMNMSFVMDPETRTLLDYRLIGDRSCYPEGPAKLPFLKDCTFTSGIVPRPDGKVDLYSGINDCQEGRITIDNPFAGFGNIVGVL